jgi:hypothetical protein
MAAAFSYVHEIIFKSKKKAIPICYKVHSRLNNTIENTRFKN